MNDAGERLVEGQQAGHTNEPHPIHGPCPLRPDVLPNTVHLRMGASRLIEVDSLLYQPM